MEHKEVCKWSQDCLYNRQVIIPAVIIQHCREANTGLLDPLHLLIAQYADPGLSLEWKMADYQIVGNNHIDCLMGIMYECAKRHTYNHVILPSAAS
jgi:hypothetical protein